MTRPDHDSTITVTGYILLEKHALIKTASEMAAGGGVGEWGGGISTQKGCNATLPSRPDPTMTRPRPDPTMTRPDHDSTITVTGYIFLGKSRPYQDSQRHGGKGWEGVEGGISAQKGVNATFPSRPEPTMT